MVASRLVVSAIGITLCLVTACTQPSEDGANSDNSLPNIVVLFADDLGYGDLGSYGHPRIRTPNLDRMAEEGNRLTSFYVGASVCSPSRAALLTGRYPVRTGITRALNARSEEGLPHDEITVAEVLKQQGYTTMAIGKWHLGHRDEYLPTNHGFDGYLGVPYSNDLNRPDSMPNSYMHGPPLPLIRDTAVVEQPVDQSTLTERYTSEALEFISSDTNEPFFLYLPYTMPHVPLNTSPRFRDASKAGLYGAVVRGLDWSVGQILDTLRQTGLDDNTLVFFTSDNGPFLNVGAEGFAYPPEQVKSWHHGSSGLLRGGKFTQYEGGLRVPAIAWWPGEISAGQTCSEPVTAMDLFPTFINIAGGEVPNDRTIDGKDVMPVLQNCASSPTDEVFYLNHGRERFAGIRKGPWKLLISNLTRQSDRDTPVELYNLTVDPSERHNVASKHPNIVKKLQTRLKTFENEIGTTP